MTETADQSTPEAPASESVEPKTFSEEYVRQLRAESASYRTKAKENEQAAAELQALRDAEKTDLQKAIDRAVEAETRLAEFETREQVSAWASEIVAGSGIPASVLRGSTKEDLQAHFDDLQRLVSAQPVAPVVPGAGRAPSVSAGPEEAFVNAIQNLL